MAYTPPHVLGMIPQQVGGTWATGLRPCVGTVRRGRSPLAEDVAVDACAADASIRQAGCGLHVWFPRIRNLVRSKGERVRQVHPRRLARLRGGARGL